MKEKLQGLRFINPPALPAPVGYSHVAVASGGRTIYISGQVALDAARNLVGPDDLRSQTRQVFENLKAALEAADADFSHVVKLTFFLLDISQIQVVREVRDQYINTQSPPASSAVEVRRLFRDDVLVEVDAVAVVPG
jgi:reactive intermediate/imine deaminase